MISSKELAILIADALFESLLVKHEDLEKAEEIIEEEITVRLALGDEIKIERCLKQ